jgi:hypothetical protein
MRRQRSQLGVSLFPFLSVLLCTLGSLIFLLLVLDQQARRQREAELHQRHEAIQAERLKKERQITEQLAEAAKRLEQIRKQTQEQAEGLRRERARIEEELLMGQQLVQELSKNVRGFEKRRAALQRHLSDVLSNNDRLQKETDQLLVEEVNLQKREESLRADLALLEEQVSALEKVLARLSQGADQPPERVYSLIPYRGRFGAKRRPIYLECVGQQIHLRPEGPSLFVTDLLEPDRLEQEIRRRAAQLASEQRPYVLLLVRPSGIPIYYVALRELTKTDFDLGYELIDEDWILDFSEPSAEDLLAEEARAEKQRQRLGQPTQGQPKAAAGFLEGGRTSRSDPAATGVATSPGKAGARTPGMMNNQPPQPAAGPKVSRPIPVGGSVAEDKPLVLECRAEGVVFWPDKTTVSTADLFGLVQPGQTHPFVDRVNTFLDRRRRAGFESVPRVRVYVRPDGLRTYYRVATLLESLAVRTEVETIRSDTNMEALLP